MRWLSVLPLLVATCGLAGEISYETAYQAAQDGQPLVVVVSGPNCPHCIHLVRDLVRDGLPFVHADSNDEIGRLFYVRGPVPQTFVRIRCRLSPSGWIGRTAVVGDIRAAGVREIIRKLRVEN